MVPKKNASLLSMSALGKPLHNRNKDESGHLVCATDMFPNGLGRWLQKTHDFTPNLHYTNSSLPIVTQTPGPAPPLCPFQTPLPPRVAHVGCLATAIDPTNLKLL